MDPLSAGIGAAGSVLSSVIGNIGAKKREENARKANIEFWNMQNQYNTPKQQMQRFKEAGLNPNLIYGKGTPGLASPVSPAKAAPYKMENPINSMVQAGLAPLQGNKMLADTAKAIQDTEKSKIDTKLLETNFDSLVELQSYQTATAFQNLLQSQIATVVKDNTKREKINQEITKLAILNQDLDIRESQANVERFKSDLADQGITINDNIIHRLLGLAAQAIGIDIKSMEFPIK